MVCKAIKRVVRTETIDFMSETVIPAEKVCEMFRKADGEPLSRRTVDAWFAHGLRAGKMGGLVYTSLEALQEFQKPVVHDRLQVVGKRRRDLAAEAAEDAAEQADFEAAVKSL
jgi:hypothetical protein